MSNQPKSIIFDRTQRPDFDFDITTLDALRLKKNLDPVPYKPHIVQFYLIILLTDGVGKHTIDFNTYEFGRGSVLTIRKDQIHHFHRNNAKGYLLLFTEEYVQSHHEQASAEKIPELFNELLFSQHTQLNESDFEKVLMLIDQILEEFNQPVDSHTSGIIRNLLQVLVSKIHRLRTPHQERNQGRKYTTKFMDFQRLVEQYCRENRTVQFYADQLHVTPRTLNNITHEVINKSAKKFIDEICVLQIKRLLINTPLAVKEIAYQSGFNDPTNFFKYFKRFTGLTPETFRAAYSM